LEKGGYPKHQAGLSKLSTGISFPSWAMA